MQFYNQEHFCLNSLKARDPFPSTTSLLWAFVTKESDWEGSILKQEAGQVVRLNIIKGYPHIKLENSTSKRKDATTMTKRLQKHICASHHKKVSLCTQNVSQNAKSKPLAYCFVLHKLHLKSCDLTTERIDLLTSSVLIDHHLVLDISSSIGIFQGI